ncbi:MAG: glycerol-3-phosphate 1-O-acyltransferase [Gemmatimonadetes bacterium]|nr:MAG: glycerol-3-phosphate 1-O-acyltransferase [Gemmatimonadota bacterium]
MTVLVLVVLAYLIGSFPTSYLIGRIRGIDLREHGSRNLGTTNTFRVLGAWSAIPVLVVDVLKGLGPALWFVTWDGAGDTRLAVVYGLAAIIGHVWSVFLGFRGGKGIATGAGVLLALAPVTTIIAVLIWIGIVSLTRIVSAASLTAASVVPLLAWLMDQPRHTVTFCLVVACFVWWTHRENLRRLLNGTENKFSSKGST